MWDAVGHGGSAFTLWGSLLRQSPTPRVSYRKEVWVPCSQDFQLLPFLPCQCTFYICPLSLSLGSVPSQVFRKRASPANLIGSLLRKWLPISARPPTLLSHHSPHSQCPLPYHISHRSCSQHFLFFSHLSNGCLPATLTQSRERWWELFTLYPLHSTDPQSCWRFVGDSVEHDLELSNQGVRDWGYWSIDACQLLVENRSLETVPQCSLHALHLS